MKHNISNRCLQAIIDQTGLPEEIEVIVADGMSD